MAKGFSLNGRRVKRYLNQRTDEMTASKRVANQWYDNGDTVGFMDLHWGTWEVYHWEVPPAPGV